MDSTHELEKLAPQWVTVRAGGADLTIEPIQAGQLPAFVRAIKGIRFDLSGSNIDYIELIGTHGDAIIEAASIASGCDRDWIAKLGIDEFVALVTAIIEVNATFFVERLLPAMTAILAGLSKAAGSMSSRGSSQQGTAGPM